jgi:hypothetical protein
MRHPPRLHQFDSDPGWVGTNLGEFYADADYTRRRAVIQRARHRGSMPTDVARELQLAVTHGLLRLVQGEITRAEAIPSGLRLEIHVDTIPGLAPLSVDFGRAQHAAPLQHRVEVTNSHSYPAPETWHLKPETLTADTLILATGLDPRRPGGDWLEAAIHAYGLPLAPDGYPIVDGRLCWAEGLYVSGPLAELEIGPVARNIIGARLAAERIGTL